MGSLDVELIYIFQGLGSGIKSFMNFFTSLGYGEFYLVVIAAIYWSWNQKLGIRIGIAVLFGSQINTLLKISIRGPRPYWLDSAVIAGGVEHSFGMPSGHAQSSVSFWGMWGVNVQKKWFWFIGIIFIFFTGLSRSVLGVHFPSQVVVGWILGLFFVLLIYIFERSFIDWYKEKNIGYQLIFAFIISSICLVLMYIVRLCQGDWVVPEEWMERAVSAHSDHSIITPLSLLGLFRDSAILFGFLSGSILLERYYTYNAGGVVWKRLLRFILGIVCTLTLWYGLGALTKGVEHVVTTYILQYSRSLLFGFFITFIWPWICIRSKLTDRE